MIGGVLSITPEQLHSRLASGDAPRLIDVREREEWVIARIAGAEHVPLGEIPDRLPGRIGLDEEVVVYCHHGIRSALVQNWLLNQGYRHVVNLEGGIDAWAVRVEPGMVRY